jgi:mannitol/fructose-specific phosphotransferase system IIA component (Ntr-type)
VEDFFKQVADAISPRLGIGADELFKLLIEREKQGSTVLRPDLAIPHIIIPGQQAFDIIIARCREGVFFSDKESAVRAVFVIIGTTDVRNFHLHALASIAQIVHDANFEAKWAKAKSKEALRDIILLGDRRRLAGGKSSSLFA